MAARRGRRLRRPRSGCVSLLDPGTSPFASYFEGASEDGENVYMASSDSLAPQDVDHGLRDLYDVRTGGGIPASRSSAAVQP